MSIPKRHDSNPGTYFVTSRTGHSRALFKTAPACEIFVECLLKYRDQSRYQLHAFALRPDHFQILLTPSEAKTLERSVPFIQGGFAREIRERLKMDFPVWQRGFSVHRIPEQSDYHQHLDDLLQNPVKRNIAAGPREYKWSSRSNLYGMYAWPQGLQPLATAAGRPG